MIEFKKDYIYSFKYKGKTFSWEITGLCKNPNRKGSIEVEVFDDEDFEDDYYTPGLKYLERNKHYFTIIELGYKDKLPEYYL